jgi:hypothetical protein
MWPLGTSTLQGMIKMLAVLCEPTFVGPVRLLARGVRYTFSGEWDDWKSL